MLKSGDVLDAPRLGLRFEIRRTAADTGGELTEFDAVGRPRGFVAQPHVHPRQTERLEVIEGAMSFTMNGQTRVLGPGEWVETPPGTPHRHVAAGDGPGRVRITERPSGRVEDFIADLSRMDREGEMTRVGLPKPASLSDATGLTAGWDFKAATAMALETLYIDHCYKHD